MSSLIYEAGNEALEGCCLATCTCGKKFHQDCIVQWLARGWKSHDNCPTTGLAKDVHLFKLDKTLPLLPVGEDLPLGGHRDCSTCWYESRWQRFEEAARASQVDRLRVIELGRANRCLSPLEKSMAHPANQTQQTSKGKRSGKGKGSRREQGKGQGKVIGKRDEGVTSKRADWGWQTCINKIQHTDHKAIVSRILRDRKLAVQSSPVSCARGMA